jgi:hypothetical protein
MSAACFRFLAALPPQLPPVDVLIASPGIRPGSAWASTILARIAKSVPHKGLPGRCLLLLGAQVVATPETSLLAPNSLRIRRAEAGIVPGRCLGSSGPARRVTLFYVFGLSVTLRVIFHVHRAGATDALYKH